MGAARHTRVVLGAYVVRAWASPIALADVVGGTRRALDRVVGVLDGSTPAAHVAGVGPKMAREVGPRTRAIDGISSASAAISPVPAT